MGIVTDILGGGWNALLKVLLKQLAGGYLDDNIAQVVKALPAKYRTPAGGIAVKPEDLAAFEKAHAKALLQALRHGD